MHLVQGRKANMEWKKIKDDLYYWDGSWRDIYIHHCTTEDWEKWIKFVNQNYKVDFYNGQKQIIEKQIDDKLIIDFWTGKTDLLSTATINIDDLNIKCHFFKKQEIENDIDPREIKTFEHHNKLMNYMSKLSKVLNKIIILTHENSPTTILISVDKDDIIINI